MPRAGADAVFIGKRVRQRFVGFGVHHGTVKRQEMDGSFTVLFDDGDELPYSKAALFDIMLDPPPIPQPVPAPAPGGTAAGKRKASADPARPTAPAADPAKPKRCTASDPCAACTNSIAARPPAAAERLGIDPTQLVTEVDGLKLHLSSWGALPSVNLTLFLPLYQYASERPWFRLAELLYPAVVGVASWACNHTDAYYRTSTLRPVSQIPSLPDLSPYLRHPLRLHGSQDLLHVPELGVVGPADGTFLARQW